MYQPSFGLVCACVPTHYHGNTTTSLKCASLTVVVKDSIKNTTEYALR